MINIAGLNKAEVLCALYNNSRAVGMGYIVEAINGGERMTPAIAQRVIDASPRMRFDYLQGRVLKVDLSSDRFDPYLYDRFVGQDAAERALAPLFQELDGPFT